MCHTPPFSTTESKSLLPNSIQFPSPVRWEKQVREWSAVFKDFPEIQESNVVLEAQVTHRYLINSEGTRTLQPSMLVSIEVDAGTEVELRVPASAAYSTAAVASWFSRKVAGKS